MSTKPTFFLTTDGPPRLRAGWRLALHFTALMIVAIVLTGSVALVDYAVDGEVTPVEEQTAAMPLVGNGAVVVATWWAARYVDRRPLRDYGLRIDRRWRRDYLAGLGFGTLQMSFVFGVLWSSGAIAVEDVRFDVVVAVALAAAAVVQIAVGFGEELLTRGYQFVNLEEGLRGLSLPPRHAAAGAAVVTSAVFGLLHAANDHATVVSTLSLAFSGVAFAVTVLATRQLGLAMGVHTSWNFVQGAVFGFAVSGYPPKHPLLVIWLEGPVILTGGRFGPEAGILALIADALLIAATIVYARATGRVGLKPALRS